MGIDDARMQWDMQYIDPAYNHCKNFDQYRNGYGQILERNEEVIVDANCEVSRLEDYRLDEASNICTQESDGSTICPSCGRKIGEFESHTVYITYDEVMACDDSPSGEAWEFEDRLTGIA